MPKRIIGLGAALVAAVGLAVLATMHPGRATVIRAVQPDPTSGTAPYVVAMSPMGEVSFPGVPRRIVTLDANYNDMLVASATDAGLVATGYQGNAYDGFYRQLPGVRAVSDSARMRYLASAGGGTFDKELLYALHPDVFHIDPVKLASVRGWSAADVEEVSRNVAPFFANAYSRENNYTGDRPYSYYTLWELSEKTAEVYRCPERIRLLKAVYDDLAGLISSRLPPSDQRPRLGLVFYGNGKFTPYSIDSGGYGQAQYRDVGARDAFAGLAGRTYGHAAGSGATLDLEGLLAIDPDVIIVPFAIYPTREGGTSRASFDQLLRLKDDPVAQRLTAFRTGRVFPGGTPLQGPLFYLFQIEMAAKQLYPDRFGAYRDDQAYPAGERLFDRERVARIVAGTDVRP